MAVPPNYSVELPQIKHSDSSTESAMVFVEQGHLAMPYYQASYPNLNICGWPPSSPSPLSFSKSWSPWPPFLGFVPTPAFTPHGSFYTSAAMPSPLAVLESIPPVDCDSPTDVFGEANLQPEIDHFEVPQLSTSFVGSCCAIDSLLVPDENVGGSAGGNLRRSEPEVKLMTSSSSPMELISLTEDVPREAAPRKRSRIAHACERCRIRKARCVGGNPCHRCNKRKFVCEFSASRERGLNKSRSFNLPTASQAVDGHGHHAKLQIRRQSAHSVTSGRKPPVTILKPLPKHTAISFLDSPNMEHRIDLHPQSRWTQSESDPDVMHPTSALLPISNLTLADLAGFGLDSPIITPATSAMFNSWMSDQQVENGLYTAMTELEMYSFAVIRTPPPLDDVDSMDHCPFTPFSPTIPVPLQPT